MENSKQQAFPCINPAYDGNWNKEPIKNGLTKREYFAARAMQGFLSTPDTRTWDVEKTAKQAVLQADELLKQLGE
jgi:hypothetical protein